MKHFLPLAAFLPGLALVGCLAPVSADEPAVPLVASEPEGAMEPASPELAASPVAWKERLELAYVYVEALGDYRQLGGAMRMLLERARLAGVDASGPPFALYYDDPARTPVDRLRARACLPVRSGASSASGLQADLLPRALVAYTEVRGAYPELPRVYPGLFGFLRDHGWEPSGPLREIYYVDPGSVADWSELASEVQLPWQPAR